MNNHARQSGFTLIEIVMVLILLGILAAVAVPKYFDLQKKAEIQAAKAVVAEVQARINGEFANTLLNNNLTCAEARQAAGDSVAKMEVSGFNVTLTDWTSAPASKGDFKVTVHKEAAADHTANGDLVHTGDVAVPLCK